MVRSVSEDFDYWFYLEDRDAAAGLVALSQNAVKLRDPEAAAFCTLLAFSAAPDGRNIIIHIGDGFIFGLDQSGTVKVLSEPENGTEPNETFFIGDENAEEHLRITRSYSPDIRAVLLCSDGAAAPLIDRTDNRISEAVWKLMRTVELTDADEAASVIGKALDTKIRAFTPDDMSIGIMTGITEDE